MTSNDRVALIVCLASLAIAIGVARCAGPALGHDFKYHDWLKSDGSRCCSDLERECREVRSYVGDDGRDYVFYGGIWRVVPDGARLDRESPDGNSHACVGQAGTIFCFVRGKPKS